MTHTGRRWIDEQDDDDGERMTGGVAGINSSVRPIGPTNPASAVTPVAEGGDGAAAPPITVPLPDPGSENPPVSEPAPEPAEPEPGTGPTEPTEPSEPNPVPGEPIPVPTPEPEPGMPTPPPNQEPAPVPNPTPAPEPSPGDPTGAPLPSITPGSLDAASADRSRGPVPAGTPTLADTPVEGAENLSTDEIIDRSNAGIQAAAAAGAGGATTDSGSGGAIASQLERNLKTDAQGRTIFDRKIESLEGERQQILRDLQQGGSSTELINRLLSITAQQELLHREKEKNTELLRLVTSLMLGNVPTGLVERLCALGLREVVSRVIADTVGNGRSLGREAIRALRALGSLGITISVTPEHQTEDAYREQDRDARRRAAAAIDGGQAAALWVRARRTGQEDDVPTAAPPRATWAPRVALGTTGEPAFVRWNAASTGESSGEHA